jgi:hypothetical protein
MDFQDRFHGNRDSEKRVHFSSNKVPIITDGSQQNLRCFLAKICEVRNVDFQKIPSNISQNTQNKLHSCPSNLALIIDRSI